MESMRFYDREEELGALSSVREPFLAVVYGRRRVGKTRLVLEFCRGKKFVYFFVNPEKSSRVLLEEFSRELREAMGLPPYVRPGSWREFFDVLFEFDGVVVFDEFQWFARVDPSVPFALQEFWDVRDRKPSIIVCGSVVGLVRRLFEGRGSPLYGRADVRLEVRPLWVSTVLDMLGDLGVEGLEERVRFYLVFGGVPYYYSLMWKYSVGGFEEALRRLVFEEHAPLRDEVNSVLREAFGGDYYTYASILSAIAEGHRRVSEIAGRVGLKPTSLPQYLKDLVELLGIVKPELPVGRRRGALYTIDDYFTRFWFRYVYRNRSLLEYSWSRAYERCLRTLNSYLGEAFEVLAREVVEKLAGEGKLPFTPTSVSKYYGKSPHGVFDVDVVAWDPASRTALYVEAKWSDVDHGEALRILADLSRRAAYVKVKPEKRYYGLVARRIKGKERLREEGFIALDIGDLKSLPDFRSL